MQQIHFASPAGSSGPTYGCIHLIGSHFQYYFYITHLLVVN